MEVREVKDFFSSDDLISQNAIKLIESITSECETDTLLIMLKLALNKTNQLLLIPNEIAIGEFTSWGSVATAILSKIHAVRIPFLEDIENYIESNKQGSILRHYIILRHLLIADLEVCQIPKAIELIIDLLDLVSGESILAIAGQENRLSSEEIECLTNGMLDKLKSNLESFINKVAPSKSDEFDILQISDFLRFEEGRKVVVVSENGNGIVHKCAIIRLIGSIISKIDITFATVFPAKIITKLIGNGSGPLAPFHIMKMNLLKKYDWLFAKSFDIIKAEIDYQYFLKQYDDFYQCSTVKKIKRTELPTYFKGYGVVFALYLVKSQLITKKIFYHLCEPWFVVKLCLALFRNLTSDYFAVGGYFKEVFEFVKQFLAQTDPLQLSNPNTYNYNLLSLLTGLLPLTSSCTLQVAKLISDVFEELFSKIDSVSSKHRFIQGCILDRTTGLTLGNYKEIGSTILVLYCREIRKAIALKSKDSPFLRKHSLDQILKTLENEDDQGYLNLIAGIEEIIATLTTLKGVLPPPREIGCFNKMKVFLEAKAKDLKEALISEKITKVRSTDKAENQRVKNLQKLEEEVVFYSSLEHKLKKFLKDVLDK